MIYSCKCISRLVGGLEKAGLKYVSSRKKENNKKLIQMYLPIAPPASLATHYVCIAR